MRVLLVEDDRTIAEPLVRALSREGFEVDHVTSGAAAIDAAPADVVLLDLGLPDLDGIVVCRELRRRSTDTAIIVVTARAAEMDRVTLLELGADDYVVKPFGLRELVARMRAVLRRSAPRQEAAAELEIGPVRVDLRAHTVTVGGEPVHLTPKEYDLLLFLAQDVGAVRTRDEILREVWDEHWFGSSKTLDVHMASLRRKLGAADLIETVRGVGFRLAP
ncbi:MAG: response regulator transcription factor [Acidimicrobiales bacterium]|nr:response regulator transcription factor [Acidimicrobiales bacterium]